jgi:RNA polymerase sigma-70 factor (ECF subfamily)
MTALFARRTYDPEIAVDLLAETFAAAFEERDSFRGDGDDAAIAWIYGIARHQVHEDHALAVRLRVVDELEYHQIAAAFRISEQAARARVSRGLRSPADRLTP